MTSASENPFRFDPEKAFKIAPASAAQRQEINDYWASVRAKITKPEPHVFADDVAAQIDTRRFRAAEYIRAAAHEMRQVVRLSGEVSQ